MDTVINDILIKCDNFIKNNQDNIKNKLYLYRGVLGTTTAKQLILKKYNYKNNVIYEMNVEKYRKPRDSSNQLHKVTNSFFYNKFNYYYRSASLFTTTVYDEAVSYTINKSIINDKNFAGVYVILPTNVYKLCYSTKINDLFIKFTDYIYNLIFTFIDKKIDNNNIQKILKKDNISNEKIDFIIHYVQKYKNIVNRQDIYKNIIYNEMDKFEYIESYSYYNTSAEIMCACDTYFMIPISLIDEVYNDMNI